MTNKVNKKYALFINEKQISKSHSTYDAAEIEAYERKLVGSNPRHGEFLMGCKIKEVGEKVDG